MHEIHNLEKLMRTMLIRISICTLLLAFSLVAAYAFQASSKTAEDKRQIERGRYLVENVAMCSECHTPRDAQGNLEPQALLQGAPIWIMPVKHMENWAYHAPALAGLPGLTDEEAERVLEKGVGPEGEVLRPPMHIYHMNHDDAQAIVAYLKSLPRLVH